jgi:uncharacterized protein (DUF433 family)
MERKTPDKGTKENFRLPFMPALPKFRLMMTVGRSHIAMDASGVAWIDGTNVKVIEVVQDYLIHGSSAEEIHLQHRHLSLGQIHEALAYYFDHRPEVDAQIESRYRYAEDLRKKIPQPFTRQELLDRLKPS